MASGRKKKKTKLSTSTSATMGVINYPSKDFYVDAYLRCEFNSQDEVKKKQKEIREAAKELAKSIGSPLESMGPICVISDIGDAGIERTKINTLHVDVAVFLDRPYEAFEDFEIELVEKFINKIS